MKNHKSVFIVICCYILLSFGIGISGSVGADTEVATSHKIPEGPPLFKTIEGRENLYCAAPKPRLGVAPGPWRREQCGKYCIRGLGIDRCGVGHRLTSNPNGCCVSAKYTDGEWQLEQ